MHTNLPSSLFFFFLHDIPTPDDASPYQVWLQKVQRSGKYRPDERSLKCYTFAVTLTDIKHNKPVSHKITGLAVMHQTNSKQAFLLDAPAHDDVPPYHVLDRTRTD